MRGCDTLKANIHKKLTHEDKFGRGFYCQRASRFIRHQKRENNKRFRKMLKSEIKEETNKNLVSESTVVRYEEKEEQELNKQLES